MRYRSSYRPRRPSLPTLPVVMLIGGTFGAVYMMDNASVGGLDAIGAMLPGSGCNIKGNVSINTGERIYHVPGQTYYSETLISPEHGERWFCSEADARRAGWRRSKL